jgi:hypothetical protein
VLSSIAVAKNNVPLAIRDGEFGRPTVTAVFSVIPAKAGIQRGSQQSRLDSRLRGNDELSASQNSLTECELVSKKSCRRPSIINRSEKRVVYFSDGSGNSEIIVEKAVFTIISVS